MNDASKTEIKDTNNSYAVPTEDGAGFDFYGQIDGVKHCGECGELCGSDDGRFPGTEAEARAEFGGNEPFEVLPAGTPIRDRFDSDDFDSYTDDDGGAYCYERGLKLEEEATPPEDESAALTAYERSGGLCR